MQIQETSGTGEEFTLAPVASTLGYRLKVFPSIGSTNAEAIQSALNGDQGLHWFVTTSQKSGKGRRGRSWTAPDGNLAATLLLIDEFEPASAATLGFVAGLALADAVEAILPHEVANPVKLSLKWPNDLLLNDAKLSGILLESALLQGRKIALAIGMGTNVVGVPEGLPSTAASLREFGCTRDAAALFLALSDAWCHYYRLWDGGNGLAAIRSEWLKKAYRLGEPVAIRFNERIVEGLFETIDSECRLVIREDDGICTTITAGDVYFGNAASVKASY